MIRGFNHSFLDASEIGGGRVGGPGSGSRTCLGLLVSKPSGPLYSNSAIFLCHMVHLIQILRRGSLVAKLDDETSWFQADELLIKFLLPFSYKDMLQCVLSILQKAGPSFQIIQDQKQIYFSGEKKLSSYSMCL